MTTMTAMIGGHFCAIFMLIAGLDLVLSDVHEYRLVRDLLRNYEKRIMPSQNSSKPLNVKFGVALAQIIDVDEKNQIITTNCWLNLGWLDYMLKWDPKKYNNIDVVRIPYSDVWKPDILLYNNADVGSSLSSVSTNVIVTPDGNVTWLSMWIFKSSCSMDVRYFPFDVQNCSMEFASWTFDNMKLKMVKMGENGDLTNYIPSSEWELITFSYNLHPVNFSCCPVPYDFMKYYIVLKRRPLFYLFNMVMPCILITLVALLGFYMPSDSGEKISMGITTLLSMTVFLMIVAERLPPVSDVVPLIGLYYGITIAIVSFATAMNVFTLNIHHKGSRGFEVPMLLKKVCFGVFARILFIKLDLPEPPPEPGMEKVPQGEYYKFDKFETEVPSENGGVSPRFTRRLNVANSEYCERQFVRVLQKVNWTIERNEMRLADQDRKDFIKLEWQQVALVIDRTLLVCFLILLFAVTLSILVPPDDELGDIKGH
ncbi:neuronal acetylcholine receptor subunit alpha-10-like [Ylistrum balloti]|uniref:neuronal acetylcholine receptor subunit alpha-10-like n=1 Tax=Ylistrum balloti TaxID=509963 RepID=UPI002905C9E6|nr:neuronal acetylcholine receptor subunit alpha-10-like [Ylistrum balloti]